MDNDASTIKEEVMLTMFSTMLMTVLSTIFIILWTIAGITILILDKIPKFAYAITWLTLMYVLIEIFWI